MRPRVLSASFLVLTVLSFSQVSGQVPTFQRGSPKHKGDAKIRSLDATIRSVLAPPKTVVLDVSVLDKKGQPVQGLTEKDFTVLEDGQKVDITSFVPVEADSTPDDGKADRPRLVLVFDTMRTGFQDGARVRSAISRYLTRNGGALDQPTMLLAVTQQGLVVLHGYTRDGNALSASLKELPGHLRQRYYQVSDRSNKVGEYQGDYVILKQIAESLNHVPGHKTLVWISSGGLWNSPGNSPGRRANLLISGLLFESRITLSTLSPKSNLYYLDRGPVGAWDVSGYQDGYKTELKQVSEGGSIAATSSVGSLALETGGMFLFGGNLVDKEFDRTVAAASRFYTIAYSPREGTNANAAFHKITVELQRPGLTVYARKGYYGVPSAAVASIPSGTVARMERVLANPLPYTGLAITGTSLDTAATTGKGGTVAHIQLALHSDQLTWHDQADGSRRCTLDIASAEVPTSGALVAYSVKQSVISLQASERPSAGATVTVSVLQPLADSTGYLRVALRDQGTGRIGTAEIRSSPVATSNSHP